MPNLEVYGAVLHYVVSAVSERPWVVLSNSLGTDLSMWDKQVAALERHFNVLRYDSRGHGRSSATSGFSLPDLAKDVIALLDTLGIGEAAFCGLSLGGLVVQWLAIHAPQRLSAAVLCCTAAKIGSTPGWDERIATVRAGGLKAIVPSILDRWFTPEFRAQSPADVEATRRLLESTDPDVYATTCAAIRDTDFTRQVAEIHLPTLVVCGLHDPVIPLADARFLANNIQGARLLELEAGHLANVEDADRFAESLIEFLLSVHTEERTHAGS